MATLRLLYRLPSVLVHLLLSFTSPAKAVRIGRRPLNDIVPRWWASVTCRLFGLKVSIKGEYRPGAALVVANHISWLDIPLLFSTTLMSFVSKGRCKSGR
ncbi:MAG: hypothetical protein V3R65_04985 [Acidiferrobacterales bacterium]